MEYLGPVEICITPDDKGRGIFATEDVQAGKLIMVCKALAMVRQQEFNEALSLNAAMGVKLVRLFMKSKEDLWQLYTLTNSRGNSKKDVPPMNMFGPNKTMRGGYLLKSELEDLQVDINRISGIIDVTSYTKSVFGKSLFTALWVIPGFINNLPNKSKIEIGESAFFHANKDIKAGDELTLNYLDIYAPSLVSLQETTFPVQKVPY